MKVRTLFTIAFVILISMGGTLPISSPLWPGSALSISQGAGSLQNGHNKYVIFRMDDVQDYWLEQVQMAIMDLFILKNQSLSLGLIMHAVGNDSKIINKIRDGFHKGLFELDLRGWKHIDYTKLSEQEQSNSLQIANGKMRSLFGTASRIFIPPYDPFNNATLKAMSQQGIQILSSAPYDPQANPVPDKLIWSVGDRKTTNNTYIYHIPGTILFKDYVGHGTWVRTPINKMLDALSTNIEKYGYGVLVFHPQDFAKSVNGNFVDILDQSEIKDLLSLLNYLLSENIHIISFSKLISEGAPLTKMHASSHLVDFIIQYEGNVGTLGRTPGASLPAGEKPGDIYGLYNDIEGNCTLGIGHLVHYGKCTPKDVALYKTTFRNGQTYADARQQLKDDLVIVENNVKDNVKVNLTQQEFDALVDFTFNEGVDNLKISKLLKDINAGNSDATTITNDLQAFTRGGALVHRRNDEANMFNNGVYAGLSRN